MSIKVNKIVTSEYKAQTQDPLLEQLNAGFKVHQEVVEEEYVGEPGMESILLGEINELDDELYETLGLERPSGVGQYSEDIMRYVQSAIDVKELLVTESIMSSEEEIEDVLPYVDTLLQPEEIPASFSVDFNITAADATDLTDEQVKSIMDVIIANEAVTATLELTNQAGAPIFDVRIGLLNEAGYRQFNVYDTGTYDGNPIFSRGTSDGLEYAFFNPGPYASEGVTIAYPVTATLAFTSGE